MTQRNSGSPKTITTAINNASQPNAQPTVYLGTGGYSYSDMLGTLYPVGTKKSDFLTEYAKHYGAVEINSTFYAPIGQKAFTGMLRKSEGRVRFAVKLHQAFTHAYPAHTQMSDAQIAKAITDKAEHARAFIQALAPIIEANRLAALLLQFPHGFNRTPNNRLYLAELVNWFADYPLAIEFRHASWHIPQVENSFRQQGLIWCSVDYPNVKGLPESRLIFTQDKLDQDKIAIGPTRLGYLRMHGKNLNWWDANSASERHDYRYSPTEMVNLAQAIANQRQHFDVLYIFFQNSVKAHAYYNIAMLREALEKQQFNVL